MGNAASREVLLARWAEVVNDPSLHDLPYKIEVNETGKIEMSPATNRHGILQLAIGEALSHALPDGTALVECSVMTSTGIRVADVAWISHTRAAGQPDDGPYLIAPEICVEIVSPSNSKSEIDQKTQAYLEAGATEVWVVELSGGMGIFAPSGPLVASNLVPNVVLPARRTG